MRTHVYTKVASIILILTFTNFSSKAQDVFLTTQAEVDSMAGVTSISGYLYIYGSTIFNLNGLRDLEDVGDEVIIGYNPNLTSLTGLDNLQTVGNSFAIQGNDALTDVDGLNQLHTIHGHLLIYDNRSLRNLHGLQNLYSIGRLRIYDNDALTDLTGLEGLTGTLEGIEIFANDGLLTLMGLEHLNTIAGSVQIELNPSLQNLRGLHNLTSIDGLSIYNNDTLTRLTDLANLTSIGTYLTIERNATLFDITGLENLTSIGGYVRIVNNPLLHNCDLPAICLEIASGYIIQDNATGCNTWDEICVPSFEKIVDIISSFQLSAQITKPLFIKLQQAENACNNGNEKQATNILKAFIQQVIAFSGHKITSDQAEIIILKTEDLIENSLACSSVLNLNQYPIDEVLASPWNIYPNPTAGWIYFTYPVHEVILYNVLGQEITRLQNQTELDISQENPGIYLLKLDGICHRILKQ